MKVLEAGRRTDVTTGETQPWYTHAALDEIQQWKLRDKVVLEWGGGHSSLWWAHRCLEVFTIEDSPEWCRWISGQALKKGLANLSVLHKLSSLSIDEFTQIPDGCAPDIVAIDGAHRIECLAKALTLPRPLTIIFDNWRKGEPAFWHRAEALMGSYLGVSYAQHDTYVGHEPWQTAIWHLAGDSSRPLLDVCASQRRPALSATWDGSDVERRFVYNCPGLAVIDEVLTDETLVELRRSCLGPALRSFEGHPRVSPTEGDVRHPILDSVAEEFQRRLPRVIGKRNPIQSVLNYELRPEGAGLRRDFAAIGVTLWIAPGRGRDGLVFYDVRTPKEEPHGAFESRKVDIKPLPSGLRRTNAVTVPYRRNRAVIFNADLLREWPKQSSLADDDRINLTLLYGHRQPPPAFGDLIVPIRASHRAWRSAAFRKVRHR